MRAPVPVCSLFIAGALLSAAAALARAKPVAPPAATDTIVVARATPADASGALGEEPIGEPQFNTAPTPLPPNVPSVGFEANATSEFGGLIRLAGATHYVNSVTVAMSSHAIRSDFRSASPFGFSHPITLKLYAVDRRGDTPAAGELLAEVTQPFLIPWRPEPDPTATPASPLRPWRATDGNLYSGVAFNLTFDLSARALALPPEVIVTVSFNTEHYGAAPVRAPGPYNFLHVGVGNTPPTAGSSPETEAIFWKTALDANYSDAGAAGVNVLRRDTGWAGYQPAIRVNDSPYGMLASLALTLRNLPSEDVATVLALVEASDLLTSALERNLWQGNDRLRPLWGRLVFDLLAEAADPLGRFASSETPVAPHARAALDALLAAAESLAETAVGDALIVGGSVPHVTRARDAFEAATLHEPAASLDRVLNQLANAWREAQLSLR